MDSNIIDQDKTSSNIDSDNTELNPSLKLNQESYYPPPQPIYYQNQAYQMPPDQTLNYPVNNYNQQYMQPTPLGAYNPPFDVKFDQNFSNIPHKSIFQPHTNMLLIKLVHEPTFSYIIPIIIGFLFLGIGTIFLIKGEIGVFCIPLFVFLLIVFLVIYKCLELDYKYELIFGDSLLTVINKALCCRQRTSVFNKSDLIGFDIKSRTDQRKGRRGHIIIVDVYDFILLLRDGRNEKIITAPVSIFTKEEINYLLYYVNDYIKK